MKADLLRRIDQEQNGNGKRAYGVPVSSGTGLPYSASQTPQPVTIPVALETGKLHPGWLPDFTASSGYGENSPSGQQIIAPWVYLVAPLPAGATTITVTANGMAVGDNITLSHASMPNEEAVITGGPVQMGALYEYTLSRPNEQHDYPAYAMAYNRGNVSDGGWVTIVSGDQSDNLKAPHINLWAYEDGAAVRKVRLGLLSGLSAGEKAQFPTVTDWNRYSLYADDAFLRGQIIATSGNLSGNLDVGGTLRVRSGIGEAGVVVGTVEGGYGINLLNEQGRPTFAAVSPYEDSDVAVYFDDGHGEKDFYFHKVGDRYQLEIKVDTIIDGTLQANNILIGTGTYPGAFVGLHLGKETGFTGYGTDFAKQVAWDARDGKLSFGGQLIGGWEGWLGRNGMTIDARQYDSAKPLFEHAIRWLHPSNYAGAPNEFIGANIGSDRGRWWAGARRYVSDVTGVAQPPGQENEMYQAALILSAGGASTFSGQAVNIIADSYLAVWPGGGSASFFRAERVELPALDVANGLIRTATTDQGSFVGIGTETPNGARLISQADTIAQVRAQRSTGEYAAVTVAPDGDAWLSASGSIVLAPHAGSSAPNYVLPPSATRKISIGSLARPFEEVYARHGHFGTLGSQSALTGSMYLTRSAPALAANLEADNVIAYYEDSGLLPGAYIRYEDTETHAVEVLAITSTGRYAIVEEQEAWEYDVFRAAEGTAQLWYAGTVGVHLGGNATDGYVRMVGLDDNNAAIGPAMVVFQRDNGEAAANVSERAAFGNLNTFYHYTDPIYGFAAGRKEGSWVSVDEFDGFRVMFGETRLARYREAIDLGDEDGSHIHIDADDVTLYAGSTPMIELFGTGDANITGTLAVATGGAISAAGGNMVLDENGLIVHDLTGASIITPIFGIGLTQDVLRGSERFDTWSAVGTASVTPDTHVSPDGGTQDADTVSLPAAGDYILKTTITSPTLAAGASGIFSIWLKATTAGTIRLSASRPVAGMTESNTDINVSTVWRRVSLIFTNDTAYSIPVNISLKRNDADQLAEIIAWGAQVTFDMTREVPYWPYQNEGNGLENGMFVKGMLGVSGKQNQLIIGSAWSTPPTGAYTVAIGFNTAYESTGARLIAIGNSAGHSSSGADVIAIGRLATAAAYGNVILLGPYATATAANQIVLGSSTVEYTDFYAGGGVTQSTPPAFTIHATGGLGTNIAGGALKLAGGQGTGTGVGGSVVIQTAPAGGAGSSQNALVDRITVGQNGTIDFHSNTIANWAGPGGSTSRWRTWFGA